jgi:hypothetical protein
MCIYVQVLHPIFQEDELTLIIAGGVLGALAGGLQWWINVLLDKREEKRKKEEQQKRDFSKASIIDGSLDTPPTPA